MIMNGDRVWIRPEWQDPNDDKYQWQAVSDESKGRVDICPISIGMATLPVSTVKVDRLLNSDPKDSERSEHDQS